LLDSEWYVQEIQSGASADQESGSQYQFKNLRSQLWWQFKEGLKEGSIKFSPELQACEYWDELTEDLMAPRYKVVNDRYIQIESKDEIKKRLGRSPDVGESLIYAHYSAGFNLLI
jgi:phage terminase large subunit